MGLDPDESVADAQLEEVVSARIDRSVEGRESRGRFHDGARDASPRPLVEGFTDNARVERRQIFSPGS